MTYSVVIPVYNGLNHLTVNLAAVLQLPVQEVIVVDDCSTDGSSHYIQSQFPKVKLLRHLQNTRFPIAANDGVALASGDIVILLNQDVKPHSDLLDTLNTLFADPQVFAVTFNENDHSWAKVTWKNGFVNFSNGQMDHKIHYSFWASGGSAAFRRSFWKELHGFDAVFTPGYFEDFDLGWRAWKNGWKIIWSPLAQVDHPHPESASKAAFKPRHLLRIKERNFLLAHWKNLDLTLLPLHFLGIFRRLVFHPGYLVCLLSALEKLPAIIYFRIKNCRSSKESNRKIFAFLQKNLSHPI